MRRIMSMAITQDKASPFEILSIFNWREGDDLEFKSAKGGLPQSLWETYSAMANTQGGIILLGVADDAAIIGLSNPDEIRKNFWDTVNNKSKVNSNILESSDVQVIEHADKILIAIRVPRASRYQKPVFVGQNPLTGTYKRNYEGDYRCTEQEVFRIFSDRSTQAFDSRILDRYTIEDLDLESLHQYRNRFRSHKLAHPWLDLDDQSFLARLGGWDECKQTGQKGVTVAGMLMFGREEILRKTVPQYSVDYREKFSEDPYVRWTDRLMIDGTWPGNLFQFYIKVIQKLFSDLKVPFQLDSELFRKGETIVHEAVREALVNALIHADYLGQGGVIIEKYRDRFEFSNPGMLLITMDQLLGGNVSECRNKSLQTMFTMIGAAEKAGSGVDKIWRGWRSQHWRHPIVRERVQPDRVLWTLPMISLLPEESLARLGQRFGSKFQRFTALETQALVTADIEGFVDNARMRQMTTEHSADITKVLQTLISKGALIQDGQGRWTRYRLASPSVPKESSYQHKEIYPLHKDGYPLHKDGYPLHKDGYPLRSGVGLAFVKEPSDGDWEELEEIARPAQQNKRLSYQELEIILLRLCEGRWLTRKRLAELLGRNDEGLRNRFLAPMVERELLCLRYPGMPGRVDQAYTKNIQD